MRGGKIGGKGRCGVSGASDTSIRTRAPSVKVNGISVVEREDGGEDSRVKARLEARRKFIAKKMFVSYIKDRKDAHIYL
jgi:hypothetical protein